MDNYSGKHIYEGVSILSVKNKSILLMIIFILFFPILIDAKSLTTNGLTPQQDSISPLLSIQSPTGLMTNSSQFELTLTATDETGLDTLTLLFGNTLIYSLSYEGDIITHQLTFLQNQLFFTTIIDLSDFSGDNPPSEFIIRITDIMGNTASETLSITADLTIPTINFTNYVNDDTIKIYELLLTWEISDDSELDFQELYLNSELIQSVPEDSQEITIDLRFLGNPEMSVYLNFKLIVSDIRGNQNEAHLRLIFDPSTSEEREFYDFNTTEQILVTIIIISTLLFLFIIIKLVGRKKYENSINKIIKNDPFELVTNQGAEYLIDRGMEYSILLTISSELLTHMMRVKQSRISDVSHEVLQFKSMLDMYVFNPEIDQGLTQLLREGFYHWLDQIQERIK